MSASIGWQPAEARVRLLHRADRRVLRARGRDLVDVVRALRGRLGGGDRDLGVDRPLLAAAVLLGGAVAVCSWTMPWAIRAVALAVVVASASLSGVTDSTGTPQTGFMFAGVALRGLGARPAPICEFMIR